MTDLELDGLSTRGWFMRDGFQPAVGTAVIAAERLDQYRPAGLSRDHHRNDEVRGDESLWLTPEDPALAVLFAAFEALRTEVNLDAWLGLTRFDLQFTHYAGGGARYVRHLDALPGRHNRRLTAISYLNDAWTPPDGGKLKLHLKPAVEIEPLIGRLVVFLSEKVEHEVMPVWASRFAATAWFYGA